MKRDDRERDTGPRTAQTELRYWKERPTFEPVFQTSLDLLGSPNAIDVRERRERWVRGETGSGVKCGS